MSQRLRPERDRGFTLIELLVVMALVAVVVPTLAIGVMIYFKSSFNAAIRADQAHYSQLWSAAMQADLASAATATTSSGGCPQDAALALAWSQPNPLPNGLAGAPTTFTVTYAVSSASGSDGPFALERTSSVDGTRVVARNLLTACDVQFAIASGEVRAQVLQRTASADSPTGTTYTFGRPGVRQ